MTALLCLFTEEVNSGQSFMNWPLHITLVPWFELKDDKLSSFLDELARVGKVIGPLKLDTRGVAYFSHDRVKVTLINNDDSLFRLHNKLLKLLDRFHVNLEASKYTANHYRPHITHNKHGSMIPKSISVNKVHMVVKTEGNYRKIIKEINLGGH
jgi:2'-5' RNA ligase